MAKYCYKCGAEMDEEDGFCPECGAAVVELAGKKKSVAKNLSESKIKKKSIAMLGIGAIAFIVILAIALLTKGSGAGFSSPEKAFEAWLNGYNHHDFDLMLRAEPDFQIEYEGGKTQLKETLQRNYDNDVAGRSDHQYRYEAIGHTVLDKDEAKEFEQKISKEFDTNVKFSAVATVDYELIMEYEDGELRSASIGGYAIKYKGKWYYINYWSERRE